VISVARRYPRCAALNAGFSKKDIPVGPLWPRRNRTGCKLIWERNLLKLIAAHAQIASASIRRKERERTHDRVSLLHAPWRRSLVRPNLLRLEHAGAVSKRFWLPASVATFSSSNRSHRDCGTISRQTSSSRAPVDVARLQQRLGGVDDDNPSVVSAGIMSTLSRQRRKPTRTSPVSVDIMRPGVLPSRHKAR
jgi:hypothetical protein